ncbi:MAG: hypothetical protein HY748_13705 [Elusimicrobia bacterium]|nr:hypothetical protein [Elusimicrobiota bacterium]
MNQLKAGAALVFAALMTGGCSCFKSAGAFDASKAAASETRMWKAYYGGDGEALARELQQLVADQFRLSRDQAMQVAGPMAKSAVKFLNTREDYEAAVLPDLRAGYERLKALRGLPSDPEKAAAAELDWWVARRTPGQDSPEEVGRRITKLYAVIYGAEKPGFDKAGLLRAKAAHVRDRGGSGCDWGEVEKLLRESYDALSRAL